MLEAYRQIVGDAAFFAFQRALLAEHGGGDINAAEFIALAKRIAQERSGFTGSNLTKLDTFFQQWIYLAGKPAMTPTTFFQSSSTDGTVSGTVPATLSLSLGGAPSFGAFVPGVAGTYNASTAATVVSSAGDGAAVRVRPELERARPARQRRVRAGGAAAGQGLQRRRHRERVHATR